MNSYLAALHRNIRRAPAALALSLLSACGGDGTSDVAFIPPPPPTPTPTPAPTLAAGTVTYSEPVAFNVQLSWLDSPGTRAGTDDLIGRLTLTPGSGVPTSYRATAPGEFTMTVTRPPTGALNYTLNSNAGILPGGLTKVTVGSPEISWDINPMVAYRYTDPYGDTPQYLGQRLAGVSNSSGAQLFSYDFTRGATGFGQTLSADTNLRTTLDYDIGYSYVAMGEWSWRVVDLNGKPAGDFGDLLFVNGDRTAPSDIPTSGTATYDARSLALKSSSTALGIPFTLTADFGQRTIATRIDQDYQYDTVAGATDPTGTDFPIFGIHIAGSAPFSNSGSFDIPLSGTVNYSAVNSQVTPPAEAATGAMNGAFFGPHAEQVGGTFAVGRSDGTLLMQDAFVGQQHH